MKIMKVLTLDDFSLEGKTVFLRVDMNCPIDLDTMEISGTKRIEEAIETIKSLDKTKLVITSHQGRVGNNDYTGMDKHAEMLEKMLNKKNQICGGCNWTGCPKRNKKFTER